MPVNETTIASSGTQLVAGANDYNSYNNQGQDGYFWSSDGGVTWSDAGPIDVFPQDPNNGAGDPGVAIDGNGVVYYSSIFFNFNSCTVGGVELLRRDPNTGTWSYYQIANDSNSQFQDKPAIALDSANHHVLVSWTQFGSCSGVNVTSPIRVAIFADGATSVAPTTTLTNVPGSTYSQGSSLAPDGSGGFWLTWEEYPGNGSQGEIRLAHYTGSGWASFSNNANQGWEKISPAGFTDLPNPLPGFAFRTNSLPALTVVGTSPRVVWTSYDSHAGRAYLWSGGPGVTVISNTGGDSSSPRSRPTTPAGSTSPTAKSPTRAPEPTTNGS